MKPDAGDRWIGAIPYFPSDSRLWIRGPSGALKPNAARPIGRLLWIVIGLLIAALLAAVIWAAFG